MNNLQIINTIISALGDRYTTINSYNNTDEIDPAGTIAAVVADVENLHHGNSRDCRISININGQVYTE